MDFGLKHFKATDSTTHQVEFFFFKLELFRDLKFLIMVPQCPHPSKYGYSYKFSPFTFYLRKTCWNEPIKHFSLIFQKNSIELDGILFNTTHTIIFCTDFLFLNP